MSDEIEVLRVKIKKLESEVASLWQVDAQHEKIMAELEAMRLWYGELKTTAKAGKVAFAVIGALLGLIATALVVINQWPR